MLQLSLNPVALRSEKEAPSTGEMDLQQVRKYYKLWKRHAEKLEKH